MSTSLSKLEKIAKGLIYLGILYYLVLQIFIIFNLRLPFQIAVLSFLAYVLVDLFIFLPVKYSHKKISKFIIIFSAISGWFGFIGGLFIIKKFYLEQLVLFVIPMTILVYTSWKAPK